MQNASNDNNNNRKKKYFEYQQKSRSFLPFHQHLGTDLVSRCAVYMPIAWIGMSCDVSQRCSQRNALLSGKSLDTPFALNCFLICGALLCFTYIRLSASGFCTLNSIALNLWIKNDVQAAVEERRALQKQCWGRN